jgi:hypothetical protein
MVAAYLYPTGLSGLSCEAVLPGFVLDMTKVWG